MNGRLVGLVSLALLLGSAVGADASGSGRCGPYCPPGVGCYPTVSYTYRTEYRPVQRTVCELVPETTTVDVTVCYTEPVTQKQNVTYYETVHRPMKGTRTVCRPVTEKQQV